MPRSDALSVARVRAPSDAEWDAAWLASDRATWFQSRAWAEIWAEVRRDQLVPAARVVELSDGTSALLPLCAEAHGGFCASPAGTYGGWIAEDRLEKAHAERLFAYLLAEVPGLSWRVSPWDRFAAELAAGMGEPETTRALRLESGFDALLRRFQNGPRWGVRRAQREGIEVGIAIEIDDWHAYYALYRDSHARWSARATSRHPWDLFAEIRLRDPENARLWVARRGREIVAGALVFYAPRHAAWWHSSVSSAHLGKRPMNLLLHEIIRDACEQDLATLDLGPSHGHTGIEEFKAGYAAERLRCPMIRTEPRGWRTRLRRTLGAWMR